MSGVGSRTSRRGKQRSGQIEKAFEEQAMESDLKGLHFTEVSLATWRGGLTGGPRRVWAWELGRT